jgi:hypothetical protein
MAGERVMSATSPLTVEVQEYLRDRRRLGFSLAREGTQLMAFARFADSHGYDGHLVEATAVAWAQHGQPRQRGDVDLANGLLTLKKTKFARSRVVPLHRNTRRALADYASVRDRAIPAPLQAEMFFLSARGVKLDCRTVEYTFARLRKQLGWKARGHHAAPRLHDLRHTFICNRLLAWYREGVDVNSAILALSTYVGHTQVTDTYWYLTGIPELMTIAAQRFERFATGGER